MLCEMNDKARRLCDLMKQGIVEFMFVKKSTGKKRTAHGTLNRKLIPPEAQRKRGRPKKRPDDLVIYYDTDKQAIRSFKDYLLKSYKKIRTSSKKDDNGSSNEVNKKNINDKLSIDQDKNKK